MPTSVGHTKTEVTTDEYTYTSALQHPRLPTPTHRTLAWILRAVRVDRTRISSTFIHSNAL